jgi:hypothetical protein
MYVCISKIRMYICIKFAHKQFVNVKVIIVHTFMYVLNNVAVLGWVIR